MVGVLDGQCLAEKTVGQVQRAPAVIDLPERRAQTSVDFRFVAKLRADAPRALREHLGHGDVPLGPLEGASALQELHQEVDRAPRGLGFGPGAFFGFARAVALASDPRVASVRRAAAAGRVRLVLFPDDDPSLAGALERLLELGRAVPRPGLELEARLAMAERHRRTRPRDFVALAEALARQGELVLAVELPEADGDPARAELLTALERVRGVTVERIPAPEPAPKKTGNGKNHVDAPRRDFPGPRLVPTD